MKLPPNRSSSYAGAVFAEQPQLVAAVGTVEPLQPVAAEQQPVAVAPQLVMTPDKRKFVASYCH